MGVSPPPTPFSPDSEADTPRGCCLGVVSGKPRILGWFECFFSLFELFFSCPVFFFSIEFKGIPPLLVFAPARLFFPLDPSWVDRFFSRFCCPFSPYGGVVFLAPLLWATFAAEAVVYSKSKFFRAREARHFFLRRVVFFYLLWFDFRGGGGGGGPLPRFLDSPIWFPRF